MHETITKLRILARAEITLARINAERVAKRAVLYAISVGLVLLAVVMVNVGIYQLLAETYSNAVAAFLVAAGNVVLAAMLLLAARLLKPGSEEQMVREIREMALGEVTADIDGIKADFAQLGSDVKRIRRGFSALGSSGGFGLGLVSLAPAIATIIEAIKQRRKNRKAGAPAA